MRQRILTIDLDGVGWKSSWQIKKGTTRISVKKDGSRSQFFSIEAQGLLGR